MEIKDFIENQDEIVRLYILLKPEDIAKDMSYSAQQYFNSPQYRSPLYRFVVNLTLEQIDILNLSLVIGCWLYDSPEEYKYEYLNNLISQNVHIYNIEKWCAKIRTDINSSIYLKIFLKRYLNINVDLFLSLSYL